MRLFIAIELDDRIKDELCFIQKRLKMQGMKGLPTDSPFPAVMEVEYISLMRSDRGRNGMIYTNMGDFACN